MVRLTQYNFTYKQWRNMPDVSNDRCIDKLATYESTDLEPEEIEDLKESEDYWHREAFKWAARLGESKIKFRELLNQFGISEDNFKDDELEKFLYANRQQNKEDADAKRK